MSSIMNQSRLGRELTMTSGNVSYTEQQINWMNEESYQKARREVDQWPSWKKQAYEGLSDYPSSGKKAATA